MLFAGEETKRQKEKVVEIWRQYKEKQKELSEAGADESERVKELAFLQFEVDEIVQAELKEHEDEELESLLPSYVQWKADCPERDRKLSVYRRRWGKAQAKSSEGHLEPCRKFQMLMSGCAVIYSQLADVDNLLNDFNHELAEYQKNCEFSDEDYFMKQKNG